MTTATPAKTVAATMTSLATWRSDEETRQRAELVEVDQEMQNLRAAIQNLQQQLEALVKFRDELTRKADFIGQEEIGRAYDGIFGALREQALSLADRADRGLEADDARFRSLVDGLEKGPLSGALREYRQFRETVEPTLAALPEYARTMLVAHHRGVVEKLRAHLTASASSPTPLDAPELAIEVVVGIDAPDGAPELAIVVVPVSEAVHTRWAERRDDLESRIALRVVQGIYRAVAEVGPPGAQALCGGHQGLLAIETEIVGASPEAAEAFTRHVAEALAQAPELTAARIRATVRKVPVDYLLPPEDTDHVEA